MKYQALENYLVRLNASREAVREASRVWLDAQGRAQGKYFNTTLTSAFQPIRVFGSHASDALALLDKVKPDMIKVDARELREAESAEKLLRLALAQEIQVVFKRIENPDVFNRLAECAERLSVPLYAQGYLWDTPASSLATAHRCSTLSPHAEARAA